MARIKGAKKTNRYPDEFKVKAVGWGLRELGGDYERER